MTERPETGPAGDPMVVARRLSGLLIQVAERAKAEFADSVAGFDLPLHLVRAMMSLDQPAPMRPSPTCPTSRCPPWTLPISTPSRSSPLLRSGPAYGQSKAADDLFAVSVAATGLHPFPDEATAAPENRLTPAPPRG